MGQTITQRHSTLDSLNWFLCVSIAVERVFAPLTLRCLYLGGRGKSLLFMNTSSQSFPSDLTSGLDAPLPEDTDAKSSVATVAKNKIYKGESECANVFGHFDLWTCIISNWWRCQFSPPFKWRNTRRRKNFVYYACIVNSMSASAFTDTAPSSLHRTPSSCN